MAGLQPVRTGLSQLRCPVGQNTNNRAGNCVQDCKSGYSQYNGFCVQTCPTGMALNDQKVCIRPTFNRSFYISNKTIENTTIVAAGSNIQGGGGAFSVGYFNKAERDFVFSNPQTLVGDANVVQQQTLTTGNNVPFLFGTNLPDEEGAPAQVVGIDNSFGNKEPTQDFTGKIDFETNSNNLGPNVIPTTIAKIESNASSLNDTTRQQIRADASAAQSNVIFNAQSSNDPVEQSANGPPTNPYTFKFEEPAVNVSGNLELILSGAQPIIASSVNATDGNSLQSVGFVVDQNSQGQLDNSAAGKFDNVYALATRSFALNNIVYFDATNKRQLQAAVPILDPYAGTTSIFNPDFVPINELNAGYITVGINSDIFEDGNNYNQALASALYLSTNDKDTTLELQDRSPHPINTKIESLYNGLTAGNKTKEQGLQVNHVIGFRREGAFDENGQPQIGLAQFPTDIQNYVYMFGRGFDSKSPQNSNLQSNPKDNDVILSYVVEAGQMGRPIGYTGPPAGTPPAPLPTGIQMVTNKTLVPGLWSVTGNLPESANPDLGVSPVVPTKAIEAVPITSIDDTTGIVGLGDLQYNSTSDSMVVSFCGHAPSSLGPSAAGLVGASSASDFDQSIQRFPYKGTPQRLKIPANCINVHFIIVGAGGSSETEGQGGAGSQIEGDLIANNEPGWWNVGQESELSIIVGGGGNADPNYKLQSFGGGGAGTATGVGQGGGRTSIQSVDGSGPIVLQKDRVVAAGGGGSTGLGKGGNAGAYSQGDIEQSQGSSGWPFVNGGQGATLSLASGSTFHDIPLGSAGRGGITQGQSFKSTGQAGGFSRGGSSVNQPAGSNALGSGGGGGGFFGGGAASFLGNSDDANDSPAGGGGGSSQAPSHSVKNLVSSAGSGPTPPTMSPLAMKLLANEKVGNGGSFGSSGGHGYAIIVLTNRKGTSPVKNTSGNADVAAVYQSRSNFDPRIEIPFWGKNITSSIITTRDRNSSLNNAYRAKQVPFENGQRPQGPIVSVFVNNFFILACEQGSLVQNKGFWFATLGSGTSEPKLTNQFSISSVVGNAHNIRAIRALDGFNQPSKQGPIRIALIGDGVWVITINAKQSGVYTLADFRTKNFSEAISTIDDEPLTDVFTFQDGAQNPTDAGEFLIAGVPKTISMTMSLHANLLPTFAVAVPAPDLLTWGGIGYQLLAQNTLIANPGYPKLPGANSGDWIPQNPEYISRTAVQQGTFQDNTVKMATNGTQVVSIGGYLALDATNQYSLANNTTLSGGNLAINSGSPQSFGVIEYSQSGSTTPFWLSGVMDWNTDVFYTNNPQISQSSASVNNTFGYTSWLAEETSGPLVRSPSTILISEDGGSSFNLAQSEYQTEKDASPQIHIGTGSGSIDISTTANSVYQVPTNPITNYVALPLDQAHVSNMTEANSPQVYNFYTDSSSLSAPANDQWTKNVKSSGEVTPFTNQFPTNDGLAYNMVSRFQDVCFFPDPVSKYSSTQTQNQNDVVFFKGQRQIATKAIGAALDPDTSTLWKNTEGNIPGFFVAVGCFTQDLNMCHFLGGLPLAGTVSGKYTPTPSNSGTTALVATSFGTSGTSPINWFQNAEPNVSTQVTGLMNNCIWMLHTSDIDNAKSGTAKGGVGYSFKARPLYTSRGNENFYQCLSVSNMEHQDDTGISPADSSSQYIILTTRIGLQRISHASLMAAQNTEIMTSFKYSDTQGSTGSVTQWNPQNFVSVDPIAQNVQCRSNQCDSCTSTKNNPQNQVSFAGTLDLGGEIVPLCVTPYPFLDSAGNRAFDTPLDSQGQFNLLNVLGGNGGLLQYNSIQQDASQPGSLGFVLNSDGTTGPSSANLSQNNIVALNLNFNAQIATSEDPNEPNLDSIIGFKMEDITTGNQYVISYVAPTTTDSIYQLQVGNNDPTKLPLSAGSTQLVNFQQGSSEGNSSKFNIQSTVQANANSLIVGPYITFAQNSQTRQTAVYQGPQTGEDNFNPAIGPVPDGQYTLITGTTGGRGGSLGTAFPTGTIVNVTGADGTVTQQPYATYRQTSPLQTPTGPQQNDVGIYYDQPFVWNPFLGLANSWDSNWDPQVLGRASLKKKSVPKAGMISGNPNGTPNSLLQFGQVDAGGTDLNGLYQASGVQYSDDNAWFPTYNPITYANAQLPVNGASQGPITAPFFPSGEANPPSPVAPNYGGNGTFFNGGSENTTNLSLGILQLFRLGVGSSNAGSQFQTTCDTAILSQVSASDSTQFNTSNASISFPADPSGIDGTPSMEFYSLALDQQGQMHSYQGFLTLDLVNFYTIGQDSTQPIRSGEAGTTPNYPNVSASLGSVTSTDITQFYSQQVPLLFAVNQNSDNSQVQVTQDKTSFQAMTVPTVATNFFRPRNWFFQWPQQPDGLVIPPSNFDNLFQGGFPTGGASAQLNDQPTEFIPESNTSPSQQQSEWLYPDPFTTYNGSSQVAGNIRSNFNFTLGLTQVKMPIDADGDTLTPIVLRQAQPDAVDEAQYLLNPMVPLNNPGVGTPAYQEMVNPDGAPTVTSYTEALKFARNGGSLANSTAPGFSPIVKDCKSDIVFPDGSSKNNCNNLATFLAEDAQQVSNGFPNATPPIQPGNPQSPFQCNTHGVYFSNARVLDTKANPVTINSTDSAEQGNQTSVANILEFQMDLFVNMSLLQTQSIPGSQGFSFANVSSPGWEDQSFTRPFVYNGVTGGIQNAEFNPLQPQQSNYSTQFPSSENLPQTGVFFCNVTDEGTKTLIDTSSGNVLPLVWFLLESFRIPTSNDNSVPLPPYPGNQYPKQQNAGGVPTGGSPGFNVTQNDVPYFNQVLLSAVALPSPAATTGPLIAPQVKLRAPPQVNGYSTFYAGCGFNATTGVQAPGLQIPSNIYTQNGFQELTFTTKAGVDLTLPITTALQFIRVSQTIQVPVSNNPNFQVPSAPDQATAPPGRGNPNQYDASQTLTQTSPKPGIEQFPLVGYIGPPRNYKGSSNGSKTIPAQGVLIVNAGTGQNRHNLVVALQNSFSGSRLRIKQVGNFSGSCGPCTTPGTDPLFPSAKIAVQGGSQVRTYKSILDFTVGPGLGSYNFDTSNLQSDVQLTKRIVTLGSAVSDQVQVVVDLAQGDVQMPVPSAGNNCKCSLIGGYTYQIASQKLKSNKRNPPFGKNFGDGPPATPQIDPTNNMYFVNIPFTVSNTVLTSNPVVQGSNVLMPLNLSDALIAQQPTPQSNFRSIDLSGRQSQPFFKILISGGSGYVDQFAEPSGPWYTPFVPSIVPASTAPFIGQSAPPTWWFFSVAASPNNPASVTSGNYNSTPDHGYQLQLTENGNNTPISPDGPIYMTLLQSGVDQDLSPGLNFFAPLTSSTDTTTVNIINTPLAFSWGWNGASSTPILNLSGTIQFQYSQNYVPADPPFPQIFEPNNLYQALWTPNLDILSLTDTNLQTITYRAMNINSWAIKGASTTNFKTTFKADGSQLGILPNKDLGVNIRLLLENQQQPQIQPILSGPSIVNRNSNSLMRQPTSNAPKTGSDLIQQTPWQATVTYQDIVPVGGDGATAPSGVGSSALQGALDFPTEFDPNAIYKAGSQIILDGTVYESRGRPNALTWTLITGDNCNPSPNVIVVESVQGQTVAINTQIVGLGIPAGTVITTFRQDPSIPKRRFNQVLQLTLSQNVINVNAGQNVQTTDPQTLGNFDQYFAPKRQFGSTQSARASQEFYNSSLSASKTFTANLAFANPYIAQATVPSSGGYGAMKGGLGPPVASHPQSQNPVTKGAFPSTSFLHYYSNQNLINMNTFHVNPQFNAWTCAYLFNGLKGDEMTKTEGNLSVLPFSSQYTRGTGMIPISFIVAGLSFPGSTGSSTNRVGFPNLQNSEIIYAPNLSKWTFDMTAWQHESEQANSWNQLSLAGQNTFVHPNLVRFSIPYMLDLIDAPTTNSRKPGLEQQPLPNNFICVQAYEGSSQNKRGAFALFRGPGGLPQPQTVYKDLLPSNGTQNYELAGDLIAADTKGFLEPINYDGNAPWGTLKNPIVFMTNPMKDIYHNGFNGGYNPVGQGVQHDWPASLLYGDFHLGNGDPSTNQSNNGLITQVNPAAVPPSSQRPQLGVAAVQKHQDKVYMKVDFAGKRGLWLNFPNYAMQVPAAKTLAFDQNPAIVKDSQFNTAGQQQLQYQTPLLNADPKQTLSGRQIKTFDSSHFGSERQDWEGGQVLTNRNQNDYNPSVFGYRESADQTRAPLFGWLMTQFSSTNYGEDHQYSNRQDIDTGSLLPSNPTQQTPLSSFNFVPPGVPHNNRANPSPIHSNNASTGTQPEASGVKGVANENFLMSHTWPENVVTTSLTTSVPLSGTPQSPSFSRFQKNSFNYPTTDDPGWQYNFPTGPSYSYRFDGGAVLNKDPDTTPQSSGLGGASCTTGVSIWLDASLGDTICIHQNLLRPMTTVARPSTNGSPSLPGGLTMTSWPGVTDVGVGRIYDGGSTNPDGIQNFVPEFVPDVPLVNQPFEEINQGIPVEMEPHRAGQGAYGTNDGDDPQVVCCYFSDAPDFGNTPREQGSGGLGGTESVTTNAVQSLSQSLANNNPTPSTQSCVDIYQVFPPSPQEMNVFSSEGTTVTDDTNTIFGLLGYPSQQSNTPGGNNFVGSLLPLAFIPSSSNVPSTTAPNGTGLVPQTIPDFSGLGLSLMSQDPQTQGDPATLFTGANGILLPSSANNYNWDLKDPTEAAFAAANAPIFPQNSPFFKYANLQQPLNAWTLDKTTDTTNPNAPLPILFTNINSVVTPPGSTNDNTLDLGAAQGLSHLFVGNPNLTESEYGPTRTSLFNVWNTPAQNSAGSGVNSAQPGGLTAQPLRSFPVSLTTTGTSGLTQLAPTCVGSNPILTALNRCVIGASNGTLRLFDQATNQTLSSTSLSNFQIVNKSGGATPVNVSSITQLVWYENRWFAATNYGIFQTPVDPKLAILRGNTEENIRYFNAELLAFVQLPVDSQTGAVSNASLPPCTFMRKVRFKKRSQLIASFPDQAQGAFCQSNFFPQLSQTFPPTGTTDVMQLPLNSGNATVNSAGQQANSNFALVAPGTGVAVPAVCQSFQIISKVSSRRNLNQFKVVSKFTGLPTVGYNQAAGSAGGPSTSQSTSGLPFLAATGTGPLTFMPQINSQLTDIALLNNRVVQSSMQVPQKLSTNQAPITGPNQTNLQTYVYSMAQGSFQTLMTNKNDILAPTPQKNAFQPGAAGDGAAITNPGLSSAPTTVYGDDTMRIAQCISTTNTVINTLQPNFTANGITSFLKTFFDGLQSNIQRSGQVFEVSSQSVQDPHSQDSGTGILAANGITDGLPLEGVLIFANPNPAENGLLANSLGIYVLGAPFTSSTGTLQPQTQVASVETNAFMQAFWGFNSRTMLLFGVSNPVTNTSPIIDPSLISNASTLFKALNGSIESTQSNAGVESFQFFGNGETAYFNSVIMQWNSDTSGQAKFGPKLYSADSVLNMNSPDQPPPDGTPVLNDRIFESMYVSRFNLVWANDSIGDFTYAPDLKGGILAWTVSGPQSSMPIQMSGSGQNQIDGLKENGVVKPELIQATDISPQSAFTQQTYQAPGFGLPALTTNAILAQNSQTNEFWGAGNGVGVDDQDQLDTQVAIANNLGNNIVVDASFKPYRKRSQRFMIVRNSGARGSEFFDTTSYPAGGGVPSEAVDLLPSALNWVEEINVLPTPVVSGNSQKFPVTLLSQSFEQQGNAIVTAIEFSPNATAIAGQILPTTGGQPKTALWYQNANDVSWSQGNLQVDGQITALKFIEFGWYIAVKFTLPAQGSTPALTASSLYFASANFSAITIVDTWGPQQVGIEVKSFAQTVRPDTQPCDLAAGFEPNPINPRTCLKKCPAGQDPVGDLCALRCPVNLGFKTTLVPNECLPLKQKPKKVPGIGPHTGVGAQNNEQKPVPDQVEEPKPFETIRGGLLGIVIAILLIAFIIQIVYMYRFFKITKPNF